MQKDPEEHTNQYNHPAYADIIAQMKGELERLRSHYADDTDVSLMPPDWQAQFRGEN